MIKVIPTMVVVGLAMLPFDAIAAPVIQTQSGQLSGWSWAKDFSFSSLKTLSPTKALHTFSRMIRVEFRRKIA